MQTGITLTVSEAKRLIAKAVAALPEVQKAREQGIVVVCTGSTNAYVAEEILQEPIEKRSFLTGHHKPAKPAGPSIAMPKRILDLILQNGKEVTDKTKFDMVHEMGPQDVFIKGANALNHEKGVAGIAVGDPKGGTVGGTIGPITGKKIPLIVPVGLEKLVAHDIVDTWRKLNQAGTSRSRVSGLFPVFGKIVTEIEAMAILYQVRAIHVGSGGILGAEGGTTLVLDGDEQDVAKARQGLEAIQGEPAF